MSELQITQAILVAMLVGDLQLHNSQLKLQYSYITFGPDIIIGHS